MLLLLCGCPVESGDTAHGKIKGLHTDDHIYSTNLSLCISVDTTQEGSPLAIKVL